MSRCKFHGKLLSVRAVVSGSGAAGPRAAARRPRPRPPAQSRRPPPRRTRVSTPNAIEVPGSLLEAIQQFLASDDTDTILRGDSPLTNWDRTQLELARKSWQRKLQQANGMIRAIDARLTDGGRC